MQRIIEEKSSLKNQIELLNKIRDETGVLPLEEIVKISQLKKAVGQLLYSRTYPQESDILQYVDKVRTLFES